MLSYGGKRLAVLSIVMYGDDLNVDLCINGRSTVVCDAIEDFKTSNVMIANFESRDITVLYHRKRYRKLTRTVEAKTELGFQNMDSKNGG